MWSNFIILLFTKLKSSRQIGWKKIKCSIFPLWTPITPIVYMVGADQPIVACPLPPSSDPPWPPLPPWAPLPTVVVATQQGRAGLRLKQRTRVCYRVGWWGGGGIFSRNARPLRISFVLGGLLLVATRPAGSTQFIVLARSKQCSWAFPVLQFRRCTQHHQQPPPSSRASSIWEGPPPPSQNLFSPLVRPNLHILARLDTSAR